jgi:uncharacterized membrane protein
MNWRSDSTLAGAVALYAFASLMHFAHNAEFLHEYPNLPASITRWSVYLAWLGLAVIGFGGFALYRLGWRRCGLVFLGVYAALGLYGLLHYTRAPVGAHTAMMNFTIWFECVAAIVLLLVIGATRGVSTTTQEAGT